MRPGDMVVPLHLGTALEDKPGFNGLCWPSFLFYNEHGRDRGCVRADGDSTPFKSIALVVAVPGWPDSKRTSHLILIVVEDRIMWTWADKCRVLE